MSPIVRLAKQDYPSVLPLFQGTPYGWDVLFRMVMDGYGFVLADRRREPNVALAFMGGSVIYGGNADHELARSLIHSLEIQPYILPRSPRWSELIKAEHGEKVNVLTRYYLPFPSIDADQLAAISICLEEPFRLERIGLAQAEKLQDELGEEHHLYHYSSLEDFVERGCGFCITRGDEICAATFAGARSGQQISIQVNTKEAYRRRGFATMTSAALLRYCLDQGVRADWDAATTISRDMALKLGYTECTPYEILSIMPG